ncbi:SNF2-related protein [Romboutsia sp. 1001285H_161024_C4]|uniref:SNF2-related protein n=1 Tax=Romboutsia sp. 1001285H_161024_C4 TaxID=2787109 RepID=UPI0018971A3B|nr:DEAD/DEAH box helicase [Romboutsia sp. 1001285H_161024_C4]
MISLYPHQKDVLDKTEDKNRVAYYLDMGLGKTFVGSEKLKALNESANILICQKSKIDDWYKHFKTYYPEYEVIKYNKKIEIPNKSIIIINYDLVWRRPELSGLEGFTLMLDESSMIKNTTAERTKFILKLKAKNVILLSGTPVGGKYEELYSQCKLLGWNITKKAFWNTYVDFVNMNIGGFPMKKVIGYKNIDRLKQKLRDHGAIFMKTEEVINLPEQNFIDIKVPITSEYKKFRRNRVITINDTELVGDTSLTKLLYLRQLAGQYNKHKLAALKDLLESTNDRIIIFYNFKAEYEAIQSICNKLERPISAVNGDLKDLTAYEEQDNSVTLVQYQAGAMGINLQKSNKLVYYTLPLSSELFEQSKKRIHRLGQANSCFYYYMLTENSIEQDILEVLNTRRDFTDKLFEEIEGGLF